MPQISTLPRNSRRDRMSLRRAPRSPRIGQNFQPMIGERSGEADPPNGVSLSEGRPSFREISREFLREETAPKFLRRIISFRRLHIDIRLAAFRASRSLDRPARIKKLVCCRSAPLTFAARNGGSRAPSRDVSIVRPGRRLFGIARGARSASPRKCNTKAFDGS